MLHCAAQTVSEIYRDVDRAGYTSAHNRTDS